MAIVPCKNCTARVMGCHVTCRMYKQYKKDNEITKQKRKAYLLTKEVIIESMLRNRTRR